MPNDLFLASNEPAQQAMQSIGIQRSQNALAQQTQLENVNIQQAQQRRQELEQLLRTSQNPERDGYEWAKRNDQKLYTDLSKFYLDRFMTKLDLDENGARKELETATGEKIQMGDRYIAIFKNEAGQLDPALGVVDKITKQLLKPHDTKQIAEVRNDLLRDNALKQAETRLAIAELQAKTDKSLTPYEDLRSDDPKRRSAALEHYKLMEKQHEAQFRPRAIQTIDEQGKPVTRFVTPAEGSEFPMAPTADMRNKELARSLVGNNINELEQLSNRVITEKQAIVQKAKALGRTAEAALANDPDFRTYQDARIALAGNLAVAQQGSRPSDADIKAIWLPLVPDVFRDTVDSRNMKWGLIRKFSNVPGSQGANPPPGQREINGIMYEKVEGGWRKVKK